MYSSRFCLSSSRLRLFISLHHFSGSVKTQSLQWPNPCQAERNHKLPFSMSSVILLLEDSDDEVEVGAAPRPMVIIEEKKHNRATPRPMVIDDDDDDDVHEIRFTPKPRVINIDDEEVLGLGFLWPDSSTPTRKPIEIASARDGLRCIPNDSPEDINDDPHILMCERSPQLNRQGLKKQKVMHTFSAEILSIDEVIIPPELKKAVSNEERLAVLCAKEIKLARKQAEKEEKKRQQEEAKKKQQEEVRRKKEEERSRKAAAKLEARERRKLNHEIDKLGNSKFALQNTTAIVDTKVLEKGLIGGQLLSRFGARKLLFQLGSNPLEKCIMWRTKKPTAECLENNPNKECIDLDAQVESLGSQLVLEDVEIPYILFIFEAEEFSTMVAENKLFAHVYAAQHRYPGYTLCYLVNKLMWFLQKKAQKQFELGNSKWSRPQVEKALAGLAVNFTGVHSRLCADEADVADHVTGLMRGLAESIHKPKLTHFSVCKNGEHVQKDDAFKEEIKKSLWLKALVAIPKVSGPCAMSIAKVYQNMRSLLNAYNDENKTVLEKELLLQDLSRESIFGDGLGQRIGPVCSRRIYNILMAQDGNLKADKPEE